MDYFAGKLAAVTGGSSGMGRELARRLAAQGCSVATCDWNADCRHGHSGRGPGGRT
jgi:NAD(P)-dependent dehydrogenase (short-subunit alcohol dehydrogenase family)